MRRRLFWWELAGALFTVVLGTLLHFFYEWTGGWIGAAVIAPVNESTWEHMKLLFFPLFLFSAVQLAGEGKNYPNFLAVRASSALAGLALIPVLFYTYTGIWGGHTLWADIAVFVLAVLGCFALDFRLLCRGGRHPALWQQMTGLAVLWGLVFLFVFCTFYPPHIALWQDPVTGLYGIC